MLLLAPHQAATLRDWLVPDQPGPLIGLHVLQTGNGACFVDRWPDPRTILIESGGNYSLLGDADVMKAADVERRIVGAVEAPERFVPLLRATFVDVAAWDRIVLELPGAPRFHASRSELVRRLGPTDAYHLWGLSPKVAWITKTWGGPAGLAASGHAWGAFVRGRLASVACAFFLGAHYEDLGVVTEPEFRGLGLSLAAAGALCEEIQARRRTPSWTTSPDNTASLRVAEKLGFSIHRHDRLYVIGMPVPEPARQRGE